VFILPGVCLFICLHTTSREKHSSDLHKNFTTDVSLDKKDTVSSGGEKKTKEYHNCSLIPTAENTPAPNTMAWRAGLAHLCLLWGWQVAAHIIFTALMMNTLALVQICGLQLLAFLTILTRNTQKARTSTTAADITKFLQLPRSCSGKNPLKFLDQGHDWHQYQNQMFFC